MLQDIESVSLASDEVMSSKKLMKILEVRVESLIIEDENPAASL